MADIDFRFENQWKLMTYATPLSNTYEAMSYDQKQRFLEQLQAFIRHGHCDTCSVELEIAESVLNCPECYDNRTGELIEQLHTLTGMSQFMSGSLKAYYDSLEDKEKEDFFRTIESYDRPKEESEEEEFAEEESEDGYEDDYTDSEGDQSEKKLLRKTIVHLIGLLRRHGKLRYYMGCGSEAYDLITSSYAMLLEQSKDQIDGYLAINPPDYYSRGQISKLKQLLQEFGEHAQSCDNLELLVKETSEDIAQALQ